MVKKLLLAAASLGLILVVFAIYSRKFAPTQTVRMPARGTTQQAGSQKETTPVTIKGLGLSRETEIGAGEKPLVQVFDEYGRIKYQFRSLRWEPVAEDEMHLVKAEIWIFRPSGQFVHISADEGQVVMQQVGNKDVVPKHGWLRDNVRIYIDRTTRKWREENPDRAKPEQHPDSVIHIWLDEVRFDMDLAQLMADGPLEVQSRYAEIRGRGLALHWNQVDDRIELLEIAEGDRMKLRRSGLVSFAMPGSEEELSSAEQARSSATGPPGVATNQPLVPVVGEEVATSRPTNQPASQPTRRRSRPESPKQPDTYRAVFEGNVVVVQRNQQEVTGQLHADRLELLFDLGQKEQLAVGGEPTSQPSSDTEQEPESYVELTWTGRMTMRPEAARQSSSQPAAKDRFHVVAVGNPVRLSDRQGKATCQKLVYHNETEQVWLLGRDDELVELSTGRDGRRMSGREVFFDRKEGVARIDGAGQMTDPRQSVAQVDLFGGRGGGRRGPGKDKTNIRWTKGVELELDRAVVQRTAPDGTTSTKVRQYIRQATFRGDVQMNQADQQVAAEQIVVFFDPPAEGGQIAEAANRFVADGRVVVGSNEDRISCDKLTVEMTTDQEGKNVPRLAHAIGQVVARQNERVIRADKLIARIGPVDKPDSKDRRLGITNLQAYRQVSVHDPQQKLEVTADELHCSFIAGRQIDEALVIGEPEAMVGLDDYLVHAARIELELPKQRAEVNCPGRLQFMTRQDLDGRPLDEPVPVAISWSDRMTLRGADNVCWFRGQVRSVSRTNVLTCEKLRVDFQDIPPDRAKAAQSDPYWIFGPMVRGMAERSERTTLTERVHKRPAFVVAEGDVVALSYTLDPSGQRRLSSMRVAGPEMFVDLLKDQLDVLGAGSLLIEDYRLPRLDQHQPVGEPAPLMGEFGSRGPSQTVVTWGESMSFFSGEDTAVFCGGVHMIHRAGTELALAEDLAKALEVDATALRLASGRRSNLTCRQLVLEFVRSRHATGALAAMDQTRDTELKRIEASGNVHLQDGSRTILTDRIIYDRSSEMVTIRGSRTMEARIVQHNERTGQFSLLRGPLFRLNRATNEIEAIGARILTTP